MVKREGTGVFFKILVPFIGHDDLDRKQESTPQV